MSNLDSKEEIILRIGTLDKRINLFTELAIEVQQERQQLIDSSTALFCDYQTGQELMYRPDVRLPNLWGKIRIDRIHSYIYPHMWNLAITILDAPKDPAFVGTTRWITVSNGTNDLRPVPPDEEA